jgi:hypothetical protein
MANPGEPRRDESRDAAKSATGDADWLPDDSFLLEVDDLDAPAATASSGTADASSDEFVLMDDDLAPAAPAEVAASPQEALPPAAPIPVAPKLPSWLTQDASAAEEPAAVPAPAADEADEFDAIEMTAAAAELEPIAEELEPIVAKQDGVAEIDAEPVAAERAAGESAALSAPVEAPVDRAAAPALAPVVPLRRGRRRWLAAAGMLLGAALTTAILFELDRRGVLDGLGSEMPEETIAVAPRRAPEPRGDTPTPAVVANGAGDSAPVTVPDAVAEEAGLGGGDAPAGVAAADVEIEPVASAASTGGDQAGSAADGSMPAAEVASQAPAEATLPSEILPAVEAADPVAAKPSAAVPASRTLPTAAARTARSPLEGSDTIVQLKNGHLFRGRVLRVRDTRLTLRVGAGECVFDLADIALLDATQPEYRRESDMPEASVVLRNGQRLRGRLMKQTIDNVVLVVANGQLVCPRADIREVSFTGRIHF